MGTSLCSCFPTATCAFSEHSTFFAGGEDVRRWWERLPETTVFRRFPEQNGFTHLLDIVPDADEPVLFDVEDDMEPFFPFLSLGGFLCHAAVSVADIYRWTDGAMIPGTEGIEPAPGVDLGNLDLRYADLSELDLTDADFKSSDLTGADLQLSMLPNANFNRTDRTSRQGRSQSNRYRG